MDGVNYPSNTEDEMSSIHEKHRTRTVKDFMEAAQSLHRVDLQSELEVSGIYMYICYV